MTVLERLILFTLLGHISCLEDLNKYLTESGEMTEYQKGLAHAYREVARNLDLIVQNCYSPQQYRAAKKKLSERIYGIDQC